MKRIIKSCQGDDVIIDISKKTCSKFGLTAGQRVKFLVCEAQGTFEGVGIKPQLTGTPDSQVNDVFDYKKSKPVLWFTLDGKTLSEYICPKNGAKYFEII